LPQWDQTVNACQRPPTPFDMGLFPASFDIHGGVVNNYFQLGGTHITAFLQMRVKKFIAKYNYRERTQQRAAQFKAGGRAKTPCRKLCKIYSIPLNWIYSIVFSVSYKIKNWHIKGDLVSNCMIL